MKYCFSVLMILGLAIVNGFVFGQPVSRFSGNKLARYIREYHGIEVRINSDKPLYFVGEDIFVEYEIVCATPRHKPFTRDDIVSNTIVTKDGSRVSGMIAFSNSEKAKFETMSRFTGQFNLGSYLTSENAIDIGRHNAFVPGNYRLYFDKGITSNEVEFTVVPAPDSLLPYWSDLETLMDIQEIATLNPSGANNEEMQAVCERFLLLPPEAVYRKEALSKVLETSAIYRSRWSTSDSSFYVQIIDALACESHYPSSTLVGLAQATVFHNIGVDTKRIERIRSFAEQRNHTNLADAADKLINRLNYEKMGQ